MLSTLPSDLMEHLYLFLDPQSLGTLMLVCRSFHLSLESNRVWRHLCTYHKLVNQNEIQEKSYTDFKQVFIDKTKTMLSVPMHFSGAWMNPESAYIYSVNSPNCLSGSYTKVSVCWLDIGCRTFLPKGRWTLYLHHQMPRPFAFNVKIQLEDQDCLTFPIDATEFDSLDPREFILDLWQTTPLCSFEVHQHVLNKVDLRFFEIEHGYWKTWHLDYIHFVQED